MKKFKITLYYSNLDDNLCTKDKASITFDNVEADDLYHAYLLAEKLEKKLGADWSEVNETD
jgi:hypothetical protein